MTTEEYYELWKTKYEELPDNIEEICAELGITVDYYMMEWV